MGNDIQELGLAFILGPLALLILFGLRYVSEQFGSSYVYLSIISILCGLLILKKG